ncbi:MAG: DNA polymerase III subunit delta [Rikenellaceae bacterium]|nr:DNA polymerase III subunit delta [Rikenellaceae bacterium]MCL2693186.1 DNA polymerase III subunit delta [Rikenellaceae bacterium]
MAKTGGADFRSTVTAFGQIGRDIDARRFAPVYLLMGDEAYFIDALAERLAEEVLPGEAERAFSRIVAYGKDSLSGDIVNFARQRPMMGERQVVIVRGAQQLKKLDDLSVYVKSPSPSTVLVLCHKEKSVDKRTALFKHIKEHGVVFESVRPRDYEIGAWLGELVRSKGLAIEPRALGMLTEHLGVEITRISNELDKLVTFLPAGTATITADHVERNVGISKEFNNFELTRALSERNMGRALLIAEHFAHNPKEWYATTLGVMFTHFQRIFLLNYQRWLVQKKGTPMPSDADLARMLRLTSTYFLDEYKTAAAGYPNRKVFAILGLIRDYDMRGKGMGGGDVTKGELLRELLLKIFIAPA